MGGWSEVTEAQFVKVRLAADQARQRYEDHDPLTHHHSVRVAHWAVLLASHIPGFSQSRLRRLEITAMLHDFGKTFVNPAVLRKTGPLNDTEWAELKKHPELGVKNLPVPKEYVETDGILWHHKHFNGAGYPQGHLSGISLALEARLISVADVFDALTGSRPYRTVKPCYTPVEAIDMMRGMAGTQLDPSLVSLFDTVYKIECERVGGEAGARTLQVQSVIGVEVQRARDILKTIVGPFNPSDPLKGRKADEPLLRRVVNGLVRANLDPISAENIARYVLRMPLVETFKSSDLL